MKTALFIVVLGMAAVATTTPRTERFGGGEAVITAAGGLERVVIKDSHGAMKSDSYCDGQSGSYDLVLRYAEAILRVAKSGDRRAMAALMWFPLRVNAGSNRAGHPAVRTSYVKSGADLRRRYGAIFTPNVIHALEQIEPHDVFCQDGMSMLGNGVLWATVERGTLKGAVINQ